MPPDIETMWNNATPLVQPTAVVPIQGADVEATLTELATMPLLEYDQVREARAKELNVRVSTLDAEVKKRRPQERMKILVQR